MKLIHTISEYSYLGRRRGLILQRQTISGGMGKLGQVRIINLLLSTPWFGQRTFHKDFNRRIFNDRPEYWIRFVWHAPEHDEKNPLRRMFGVFEFLYGVKAYSEDD